MVVAVGLTFAVPWGSAHGLHTVPPDPSVTESDVGVPAPETCQLKVTDAPDVMVLADAVRVKVNGTVTVTVCGPAVPPGPVAVSENVVVEVIGVTDEPEVGSPLESSGIGTAGVIVTEVAFVVAQVSVLVCPLPTVVGLAENCVICGGGGGGCATWTLTACEEPLPPAPVAVAE